MEKGGTVNCENERGREDGNDTREKEEKNLEEVIEEKLEEELSVDVDVKRRGPILWISTGCNCSILLFCPLFFFLSSNPKKVSW